MRKRGLREGDTERQRGGWTGEGRGGAGGRGHQPRSTSHAAQPRHQPRRSSHTHPATQRQSRRASHAASATPRWSLALSLIGLVPGRGGGSGGGAVDYDDIPTRIPNLGSDWGNRPGGAGRGQARFSHLFPPFICSLLGLGFRVRV